MSKVRRHRFEKIEDGSDSIDHFVSPTQKYKVDELLDYKVGDVVYFLYESVEEFPEEIGGGKITSLYANMNGNNVATVYDSHNYMRYLSLPLEKLFRRIPWEFLGKKKKKFKKVVVKPKKELAPLEPGKKRRGRPPKNREAST